MPSELENRLRRALAATSEKAPRPLSRIELPLKLERLLSPKLLGSLRPAAVLAPVIRRKTGLTMLFTRRADHLRAHKGQISFPGGRREPDDKSAAAAALRETEEEVGIKPSSVEIVGYLDDYPTITRYMVTPVVGLISGSPRFSADSNEVAEVFEVPLEYLLRLESYERKSWVRNGIKVPFFEIDYEGRIIWGATAGMLWNLANKVAALP